MTEVKKEVKEFGPYPGRYTREMISEYKTLKANIEGYIKNKLPLPTALQVQMEKFKSLGASLRRMGVKV